MTQMLSGSEPFTNGEEDLGLTVLDFWSFRYSNIERDPEYVAEFLVAKALGVDRPADLETWTLYDIDYEGRRVEVKETSYWHPFNDSGKIAQRRSFGIQKVRGDGEVPVRNNDVYVFCLLKGETREDACPLDVSHWEFYVAPTWRIDEEFGDQKTVSLTRIREIAEPLAFAEIRSAVDGALGLA